MEGCVDRLGCLLDVSNSFFLASARVYLRSGLLPSGGMETRWINWVHMKLNILLCRVWLNSIPTRERLTSRVVTMDSVMCMVGSTSMESVIIIL